MIRRRRWLGSTLSAVAVLWAASPPRAAEPSQAVRAVQTVIDVEKILLEEDLVRQARSAQERRLALTRLDELYLALDAAIQRKDTATLETLLFQVEAIERQRAEQFAAERVVIERIRDRLRRITELEERLEDLGAAEAVGGGPLRGRWAVSMLPAGQHGVFDLEQNGTIVSGTYELEGGFTGSLTGTLVERKVHLVRIDSKLGRSMELEGYLSVDGKQIRGSWLSYEMAGDSEPSGQWTAERRAATP